MAVGHRIVWCDIPVSDLDRAIAFYSAVLALPIHRQEFPGGGAIGVLPHEENQVAGCLYSGDDNRPSREGPLIYLDADGRLDEAVAAVAAHGGSVLQPRHQIGPHGFRAVVLDSEGNRVALHSR
jgi:predicted enzyme related to lactoylglutathione lyase